MPALLFFVLMPVLLAGTPAAAQPAAVSRDVRPVRRIVLTTRGSGEVLAVRISPGVPVAFVFDTPLQRRGEGVVLEGSERSRWWMAENGDLLGVLPSEDLRTGDLLKLTVRFADGEAPASADFLLIAVEPERAEPRVEVYRPPRACEPSWRKAEEERAKTFQCQLELAQVSTAWRLVPDGLTGLLASGQMDEDGVRSKVLDSGMDFTMLSNDALWAWKATSYRARGRVAVELWLSNASTHPWTAAEAVLMGEGGRRLKVLRVWQPEPIAPGGGRFRVVVEAEATEAQARGPCFLELREDGDPGRSVRLEGVTFPGSTSTEVPRR